MPECLVEKRGHVLIVTMNRPEARNAVNRFVHEGVGDALEAADKLLKAGLLTVAKAGKKNIFSGRILEIEGLPQLKIEQAFELADASAERSAAATGTGTRTGTGTGSATGRSLSNCARYPLRPHSKRIRVTAR